MRTLSFLRRPGLYASRATWSSSFRPRVERLEAREVPTTLFVVPGNVPATDGFHYHALSDAVAAAPAGSIIQIEPNSAPGAADGLNGTNPVYKANLTIQGDPADGPPNLPQVGDLKITADGVTLTNLNLALVYLNTGLKNTTISNSVVAVVDQVSGNLFGGPTILSGNTFTGFVQLGNVGGTFGDRVVNNVFTIADVNGVGLELGNEAGALVQGNTFTSTAAKVQGILIAEGGSVFILNNTITLSGGGFGSIGIHVSSLPGAFDGTGYIRNNAIDTGAGTGTGIAFSKNLGVTVFNYEADGNDLVRNFVGVSVAGDGTSGSSAFGDIDLGGGNLGSPGGNDLHGYGMIHPLAILTSNAVGTVSKVFARHNIFSVANAATVVSPQQGAIDVASPLDANTAFVADLYRDYLKRTGSAGEWAGWVNLLPGMGQAGVAAAVIRSTEASMRRVDGLYVSILGRTADPMGESGWAAVLHNGGSEEQVAAALLASPEFAQRANSLADSPASPNVSYVEALYRLLLGRAASGADIDFWVVQVSAMGRSAVASSFLSSAELRQNVVKSLYFTDPANQAMPLSGLAPNLLHRSAAPSAGELAAWAAMGMDLLSIEVAFAGTGEFYANG
jgi:hypothetical protein